MSAPDFRFVEFNSRRAMRGAVAVRVAVIENGQEEWLWMTRQDINANIKEFGPHAELLKAKLAYAKGEEK
jgi:hypothetical protein